MQRPPQPITTLFFFVISYFLAHSVCASDVYLKIDDNEFGQGLLRQRGAECLIITPSHVIENAFKIEVTAADRKKYPAEILELFPGDVGLLRPGGDSSALCGRASWSGAINLDSLLETERQGELRTMLADGSVRITPVEIVAFDKYRNINVRPRNRDDLITKGESGSPLYISGQISGMLISVKNDIGNVIRQDALTNILALFFSKNITAAKQGATVLNQVKPANPPARDSAPTNGQDFSGVIAQSAVAEYQIKLEGNSPIRLFFSATGDYQKYSVEIWDSARKVVYSNPKKRYSGTETVTIPFTAPKSDVYSLHILGVGGEGRYAFKIIPIALDSQLRNAANVLQVGDGGVEGVIAKGAIAEYRVKLEGNSPVRLNFVATGSDGVYTVEIQDSARKTVYRNPQKRYSGSETVNIPFTPPKSDTYTLQILGAEGEGRFTVKMLPVAFNAQLRDEANEIQVGGNAAEGTVALNAVAEYRIKLEANRRMQLHFSATGGEGTFNVEIADANGITVFRDPYKHFSVREPATLPFAVSKSDTYTLRIIGTEGEVRYSVKII